MLWLIIIFLALAILGVIVFLKENVLKKDTLIQDKQNLPYKKKFLLTKNEWAFYKDLKKVTDKYNLHILSKIRLADLVEVKSGLDNKTRMKYFGKIKSKHIDFALCNPENLSILLLIELDDSSHDRSDRMERDSFVENLFQETGYKLLRVRSSVDIENQICSLLELQIK